MLDDIRNSSLLVMVSAVAMAVVAIAVQPEPHGDAEPGRRAAGPPASIVLASHASPAPAVGGACEASATRTTRSAALATLPPEPGRMTPTTR